MKKYIAIGHWDYSKNTASVVAYQNTKESFAFDLKCNGFKAYVVLTEKAFETMKGMDCLELYDEVKKKTSNYRRWNDITDYLEQCSYVIDEKLASLTFNPI